MTARELSQAAAVNHTDHQANLVDEGLELVEQKMFDIVNSDVEVLRDASRHILEAGGKRIRPQLVLRSYMACGGKDLPYAVPVAAALELVHTASIVHDDINDHGLMRRGRPSVNSLWGRTFALLTGDYLFTKVYELMAPYKDLNILFAQATTAVIEGETLQASAVKNKNLTREVYLDIIARKTAALFKAGAELGGHLAGASKAEINGLSQFGYNIGLAFQIVDDILDLIADEDQIGKTSGIDLDQGKGFASIENDDPVGDIKRKLMQGDRIKEGRLQAESLVEMGIQQLDPLPESAAKQSLIDLAYLVINRAN